MSETYIMADGKRHCLNVPLDLATGNYERLSDLTVREISNDLAAEEARRISAAGLEFKRVRAELAERGLLK